jgi:hypothetical protein
MHSTMLVLPYQVSFYFAQFFDSRKVTEYFLSYLAPIFTTFFTTFFTALFTAFIMTIEKREKTPSVSLAFFRPIALIANDLLSTNLVQQANVYRAFIKLLLSRAARIIRAK